MASSSFAYPFSTYAVGVRPELGSQSRGAGSVGRNIAFPVMAIFATASAVVYAFGPWSIFSGAQNLAPATAGLHQNDFAGRAAEAAAQPSSSIKLDSSKFTEVGAQRKPPAPTKYEVIKVARRNLPHSSLGRLNQTKFSIPPPAAIVFRGLPPVAEKLASPDSVAPVPDESPASDCISSCSDLEVDKAASGSGDSVSKPQDRFQGTVEPVVANEPADGQEWPGPKDVHASASNEPTLDPQPESGTVLADGQRSQSIEPNPNEALAAQIGPSSLGNDIEIDLANSEGVAAPLQARGSKQSVPEDRNAGSRVRPAAESRTSAAAKSIANHLERIKERYPAAADPERFLARQSRTADHAASEARGSVSSASRNAEGGSASTVVIHDNQLVSIKLGELISLFEARFDRPLYVWMKSSAAASKFVTPETLAAAGIETSYDPTSKQLVFSVAGN